jgi:hypothetical protein
MLPSNQLPAPESKAEGGWAWLKARVERVELLKASHELDEWIGSDLAELERQYDRFVTVESRKIVASSVAGPTRRK